MLHKAMLLFIAHTYDMLKLTALTVLAAAFGSGIDLIDTANTHPAIMSVLAGGMVALIIKFADKWLEGRNKTVRTADKVLELEHADKKELRDQHDKLMAEQKVWWAAQHSILRAELFDVRTRGRTDRVNAERTNHAAINEIMRLQHVILGMQRTLVLAGLGIPEEAQLDLTKFMLPTWENERDELQTMDDKPGQ